MTARQPKLLMVVNDAAFFLSHRLPLAMAARAAGFDVCIATAANTGEEKIIALGFQFYPVPLTRKGGNSWREFVALLALYRLYRRLKPDVVHHVTIKPVLYGGCAARLARVPAVVSAISGLGYVFLAKGLVASIVRSLVLRGYRCALKHPNSRVIFQNPEDMALFLTHDLVAENECVLIRGSGVDLEEYRPVPEPSGIPLVILPARMLKDKGVVEFVDAARILKTQGMVARFALVGDSDEGNPAAITSEQLRLWGREGVVEWWGRREDMPEIYAMSHVVCLPSYREGLPKALLEAAASARPIVATDVPGCREIVVDGLNGLRVPVCDSNRLAYALGRLIQDSTLRVQMGEAGRRLVEQEFSVDRVICQTLTVYQGLLDSGSGKTDGIPFGR